MDTVLTLGEVAHLLKVHPSTIYRLLKQGLIPAFRIGADWRFNQDSLERWIREAEAGVGQHPVLVLSSHNTAELISETGASQDIASRLKSRTRSRRGV
jgi:excisionase family DNA binding protein